MESIILDLTPSCVKPVLHASQYDDGRQWKCNIEDNGTPYTFKEGDTAELDLRKGDGTVVTSSVAVVPGQTYAVLVSTEQMCAVWGSNLGELTIRSNGVKVGSCNFILEVEKDPTSQDKKSRSEIWDLHAQVESEVDTVMSTKGASDLAFDNTDTDLESTNTEDAIKEVDAKANTKADADSVYDKQTVDDKLGEKADTSYVNTELGKKADKSNTYTKSEVNTIADGKANASDVYNKSETYSKSEVDTLIDNLPEPMIFKGTLGVGGTITALPTASASNEGYTYKVITDGTYAGQTAKVGDVFTSNGSAWVLIPSGDEDNDTWRAIKVNGTEKLGNAISSGSVDFVDTDTVHFEFDNNGNKVKANAIQEQADWNEADNTKPDYIKNKPDLSVYAQIDDTTEVNNKVWSSKKTYDEIVAILPTGTASGSIANFDTDLSLPYQSIVSEIVATGGGGTPSTPIPINGFDSVTITQADENLQTVGTVVISLGQNVYEGQVVLTKKTSGYGVKLSVTGVKKKLSDYNWSKSALNNDGDGRVWYRSFSSDTVNKPSNATIIDSFKYQSLAGVPWENLHLYNFYATSTNIIFCVEDYSTSADMLENYGDVEITLTLVTPIENDLPDIPDINAIIGTNNVFNDTNGSISVEYKESINKAIAELQALILG